VKSYTVKLYPTRAQAAKMDEWFQIGTGVWNWALGHFMTPTPRGPLMVAKRYSEFDLNRLLAGHATRTGIHSKALEGIVRDVRIAWDAYRAELKGRPHRKGQRNRLASIPFRDDTRAGARTVRIPKLGEVKAKGQRRAVGETIKMFRLHRRPRGWYCTITTDGIPNTVPLISAGAVGIDLGYSTLATLSTGEKIEHPQEYQRAERRIGQAHRGLNLRLLGRLQQRLALSRRSRNHAISRDLVSRFSAIYVSKDNIKGFQRKWGKSVLSAGHFELREMLAAKCRQAGRVYLDVPNRHSTRACSACGSLDGPTGLRGLKVREWVCACGAQHDRDVNAARNTLIHGAVLAHEMACEGQSEISR
jgi:putative transposase